MRENESLRRSLRDQHPIAAAEEVGDEMADWEARASSDGLHKSDAASYPESSMDKMQEHWERVYGSKALDQVSWFRPHLETSLALIQRAAPSLSAAIIDVGGGASTLVDDLLARGYGGITVLDVSNTALELARGRLGLRSQDVHWLAADITKADLPDRAFDVWHDRAVFHFLTKGEERLEYVRRVASAVKPGGHVIIGTFGPGGPSKCSGLDVVRYDAASLHREFGSRFRLVHSSEELHHTPSGSTPQFLYCDCVLEQ